MESCGEGFWLGPGRRGRSIPAADCEGRGNAGSGQKTRRPEDFSRNRALASLLLRRRPLEGMLRRRASPSGLFRKNRTPRNFKTRSQRPDPKKFIKHRYTFAHPALEFNVQNSLTLLLRRSIPNPTHGDLSMVKHRDF